MSEPQPNLKWNRRSAVPVGALGVAMCVYGLVKGTWLGFAFAGLGVILILLALFHRRLKSFRFRAGPGRIEAQGEFVADLGGEDDATEPSESGDDPRPGPPQP